MNNGIIILSFLSFFHTKLCQAKSESFSVSTTLAFKTQQNFKRTVSLKIQSEKIFVNGKSLALSDLIFAYPLVSKLIRTESASNTLTCFSGNYTHTVQTESGPLKEQGCLEDARFRDLYSSFLELDALASVPD